MCWKLQSQAALRDLRAVSIVRHDSPDLTQPIVQLIVHSLSHIIFGPMNQTQTQATHAKSCHFQVTNPLSQHLPTARKQLQRGPIPFNPKPTQPVATQPIQYPQNLSLMRPVASSSHLSNLHNPVCKHDTSSLIADYLLSPQRLPSHRVSPIDQEHTNQNYPTANNLKALIAD